MSFYKEGVFSSRQSRNLLLGIHAVLFSVFVYSLNKTFDITDEAYNLLLSNPAQDVYFSQTYFFDLVKYFMGESSQLLLLNRVVCFLLLLFSHISFLWALQKLLKVQDKTLFWLFSWLGFYYCAAYTQITISYNLLNTILSLFSATALFVAIHQQQKKVLSWLCLLVAGVFLSLLLVVKFTTFFTLLLLWLLSLFLLLKGTAARFFSFVFFLAGVAAGLFFYSTAIRDLGNFREGTARGIAAYQALQEYTFQHNLGRMGAYAMAFLLMAFLFYLLFMLAGRFKDAANRLLICLGFLLLSFAYYKYSGAVAGLLLAFVSFTSSWLAYSRQFRWPREHWVVLACCFLIPYCNVIGTSDPYDFGLAHIAIPLVAVLGWFFIEPAHEQPLRYPVLLSFAVLSFFIVSYKVIRVPYRSASLYQCGMNLGAINPHFSGIYVDEKTYANLETLKALREQYADKFANRKIIAANDIVGFCSILDATMPGTVLFGSEFSSLYLGNLQEALERDSAFKAPLLLLTFNIHTPGNEKGEAEFLKQLWHLLGQKGIKTEDYVLLQHSSRNSKQNKDLYFYASDK